MNSNPIGYHCMYTGILPLESEKLFLEESDELSIHSSDDELDEYIIPREETSEEEKMIYKDESTIDQIATKSQIEDNFDDPETFYREIIQKGYIYLGLDLVGSETRRFLQKIYKKDDESFIGKRVFENLGNQSFTNQNLNLENKKVKQVDCSKLKQKQDLQLDVFTPSWIEQIYDSLSEMNKIVFKKLQREYNLANKSCKIFFRQTLQMLISRFKQVHYNASQTIEINLIQFLNFVCDFFKTSSPVPQILPPPPRQSTQIMIE